MNRFLARLAIALAALVAALGLVVAGAAFAFAALYLALVTIVSPPVACLLTALAALLLAVLVVLALRFLPRRARPAGTSGADSGFEAQLGALFGKNFQSLAQAHPHRTLIVSLIAGFVLGAYPGLGELWRDQSRE